MYEEKEVKESEKPVPADLFEAKHAFSEERFPDEKMAPLRRAARIGYEAGSKWQKSQMMKDAVEGVVTNADGAFGYDVAAFRFDDNHTYSVLLPHEEKRKYGDKVRIIIVKDD